MITVYDFLITEALITEYIESDERGKHMFWFDQRDFLPSFNKFTMEKYQCFVHDEGIDFEDEMMYTMLKLKFSKDT